MGFIYKITNDINNKSYIGKCCSNISERYKQHLRDYQKQTESHRPLYSAMNKYGIEHFSIQEIEECEDSILSSREQYWISYYDTYQNGYNATLGGDGAILYDHKQILELLKTGLAPITIADQIGCCPDVVRDLAKANKITLETNINLKKPVIQYSKNNEFIQEFKSATEAGEWCVIQGLAKGTSSTARSKITACVNCLDGSRKTAYGYIWKFKTP